MKSLFYCWYCGTPKVEVPYKIASCFMCEMVFKLLPIHQQVFQVDCGSQELKYNPTRKKNAALMGSGKRYFLILQMFSAGVYSRRGALQ